MELFVRALDQEVGKLHKNGIRFRVIGDTARFDAAHPRAHRRGEGLTAANAGLTLTIAANYGGRWDIAQAARRYFALHPEALRRRRRAARPRRSSPSWRWRMRRSRICSSAPAASSGSPTSCSGSSPTRELYFTDLLWPDFDAAALDAAIAWYRQRERRFGRTSEQVAGATRARPDAGARVSTPARPTPCCRRAFSPHWSWSRWSSRRCSACRRAHFALCPARVITVGACGMGERLLAEGLPAVRRSRRDAVAAGRCAV